MWIKREERDHMPAKEDGFSREETMDDFLEWERKLLIANGYLIRSILEIPDISPLTITFHTHSLYDPS